VPPGQELRLKQAVSSIMPIPDKVALASWLSSNHVMVLFAKHSSLNYYCIFNCRLLVILFKMQDGFSTVTPKVCPESDSGILTRQFSYYLS
jgi:hypothetical protein